MQAGKRFACLLALMLISGVIKAFATSREITFKRNGTFLCMRVRIVYEPIAGIDIEFWFVSVLDQPDATQLML